VDILNQCNVVMHLTGLLQYAFGNLQHEASTGIPESPDAFDGVKMEEVVEWSVAALHILARNPNIRAAIRSLNIIPILIQILYTNNSNMIRVVCGLLNELSRDEEGARVIEVEGATEQLQNLVHTPDTHIAAYSASVLYNILSFMDNKASAEYMKRLSVDLTNQMNNENRIRGDQEVMDSPHNYAVDDHWQNQTIPEDPNQGHQHQQGGLYGSDL